MDIVVDNSAGGDSDFAAHVARLLRARGLEVEVREPDPMAKFDTGVHLLTPGIAIRVPVGPERAALAAGDRGRRARGAAAPSERPPAHAVRSRAPRGVVSRARVDRRVRLTSDRRTSRSVRRLNARAARAAPRERRAG
jgi:hypothetical protein